MFGKILAKKKSETEEDTNNKEIIKKISKMNLSDMRFYVNNKLNDFEVCEDGLKAVMKKLVSKDANEKRFVESDAMDSKIKKAFDLVIVIAANKKMTMDTSELIKEFIDLYDDIIKKFDTDNKQIYTSKLNDALANSLITIQTMMQLNRKMDILK
ncbi:MAG: hypothetical protein Q9M32_06110 [Sulfurimonas sp.]|nr:hypothetical protein [Sulfurimonas sp.]MDQ7060586.1 hypothetical protein [Sulfurimonas sp.]